MFIKDDVTILVASHRCIRTTDTRNLSLGVVMAVADVLDALISERCYKSPVPFEESVDIMKDEGGTHFDPALIDVLLRHRDDFRRIRF